jgi:DNA-binding NarL/FixJ family response regulator
MRWRQAVSRRLNAAQSNAIANLIGPPLQSIPPTMMAAPLSVMLADDSFLVREGLAQLLGLASGVRVVSRHPDAEALLAAIEAAPPDVVIVDVRMPPTFVDEGLCVAEQLRRTHPKIGVLVIGQQCTAHGAARLLAGGSAGRGYLLKDRIHDLPQLLSAIEGVAAGECRVDPELIDSLVALRRHQQPGPIGALTPRQREILGAIAAGKSNLAIARAFDITQGAVEKHVNEIFTRLGIANDDQLSRRVHATLLYLAQGEK